VLHLVLHGIPEINKQIMLGAQTGKNSLAKEDTVTSDFIGKLILKNYFLKFLLKILIYI
jgi:hypothetical protein